MELLVNWNVWEEMISEEIEIIGTWYKRLACKQRWKRRKDTPEKSSFILGHHGTLGPFPCHNLTQDSVVP